VYRFDESGESRTPPSKVANFESKCTCGVIYDENL
jgi:hypothetical protein